MEKKSLSLFLSFIILFIVANPLWGQLAISNISDGGPISTCGSHKPFNIELVNSSSALNNITRKLSLPIGFKFSWDNTSLPTGVTLTSPIPNELNISIASIGNAQSIQFQYFIQAGCSYAPGSFPVSGMNVIVTPAAGDQVLSNTNFNVLQGTNGSLLFDPAYQIVNGADSTNWKFSGTAGQEFRRSYRFVNSSGSSFSGFLNFKNTFPVELEFLKLEYTINGITQSYSPPDVPAGVFSHSIPVNNVFNTHDIIVTEFLKIKTCFNGGLETTLEFTTGCYENESCSLLGSKNIGISRALTPPKLVRTLNNNNHYNSCIDNETQTRSITYTNVSETPAVDVILIFSTLKAGIRGYNPTLVPVESIKLTIHKKNAAPTVYAGRGLSEVFYTTLYPLEYFIKKYPNACYTGDILSGDFHYLKFHVPLLEKDEYVTFEWEEKNCCTLEALASSGHVNWDMLHTYHTISLGHTYTSPCHEAIYLGENFPDANNDPYGGANNEEYFYLDQSLLPFKPRLFGNSANSNLNGDESEITVQNYNLRTSPLPGQGFVPENSFIEVDIHLEDGLTLIAVDGQDQLILNGGVAQPYQVSMIDRLGSFRWQGIETKRSAITNQDDANDNYMSDDSMREVWTFRFPVSSLSGFDNDNVTGLYEELVKYLNASELSFNVRAICSGKGLSNFWLEMYLIPGNSSGTCNGCRIPVMGLGSNIAVTCPGCLTPGVVMQGVEIRRTTFGERDDNDDGIADKFQNIDNNGGAGPDGILDYMQPQFARFKTNYCTRNDEFETIQTISFYGGDAQFAFDNRGLQHDKQIYIDQLYVLTSVNPNIKLMHSMLDWVDQNGVQQSTVINQNKIWKMNDTTWVFNISAQDIGQKSNYPDTDNNRFAFHPGDLGTLKNKFKILNNLGDEDEIKTFEINYEGRLTDKEFANGQPIALTDGTCNGKPLSQCDSIFDGLFIDNFNFNCEPNNMGNLLFIPLKNTSGANVHNYNPNVLTCYEAGKFYLKYEHPKANAFPGEFRMYTEQAKIEFNMPAGYQIESLVVSSYIMAYNSLGEKIMPLPTDQTILLKGNPDLPVLLPADKGGLFNLTIDFVPNTPDGSNNTSKVQVTGDETMHTIVTLGAMPEHCNIKHAVFTGDSSELTNPIAYPWPSLDFTDLDIGETNPIDITTEALWVKPYTNYELLKDGGEDLSIGEADFCFNVQVQNNPVTETHAWNPGQPDQAFALGTHKENANNSFLALEGLLQIPNLEITKVTNLASGATISGIDGVYSLGNIPAPANTLYEICLHYSDCANPLINVPMKVVSGWECDGVPTMEKILEGDLCKVIKQSYTITTLPVDLVIVPEIVPASSELCSTQNYKLDVRSSGLGEISNYTVRLTLPEGFNYNSGNPATVNGNHVSQPVQDPVNQRIYIWENVYTEPLKDGQTFVFNLPLDIACSVPGGVIHAEVTGTPYCGDLIVRSADITPEITVPDSYFGNLSLDDVNCTSNSVSVFYSSGSLPGTNLLTITLPQGITFPGGGNTQVIDLANAPSPVSLAITGTRINPSDIIQVKITQSIEVSCGNNNCTKTRVLTKSCQSSDCAVTAIAGGDRTFCRGESSTLGSNPVSGNSYSWNPVEGLDDPTKANPIASPATTTIYSLSVSNGNCMATDQVEFTVNPLPMVNLVTADGQGSVIIPVCHPSVTLVAEEPGQTIPTFTSYEWFKKAPGASSFQPYLDADPVNSNISITVIEPGEYYVKVGNSYGCYDSSSSIQVINEFYITGDHEICPGESANLNVTIAGVIGSYYVQWFKNNQDAQWSPRTKGDYYALISLPGFTPACTLRTTNTFHVEELPVPTPFIVNDPGDHFMCPGEPAITLTAQAPASSPVPVTSYSWNTGASNVLNTKVNQAGHYYISALGNNGCRSASNIVLIVGPEIQITEECISPNVTQLTANLNGTGGNFEWRNEANSWLPSDNSIPNVSSTVVSSDGLYSVSALIMGCAVTETTTVCRNNTGGLDDKVIGGSFNIAGPVCNSLPFFSDLTGCTETNLPSNDWPGRFTIDSNAGIFNSGQWQGGSFPSASNNRFLLVDGKVTEKNERIWYQNVPIEECANYHFNVFVRNLINTSAVNPSELPKVYLTVNGELVGKAISYTNQPWVKLQGNWKSDVSSPTAEIAINLEKGGWVGRDIGIDEVSFTKYLCEKPITPLPCNVRANAGKDQYICPGSDATIGENITLEQGVVYSWAASPSGTVPTGIYGIVSPSVTTAYILTVIDLMNGCSSADTVIVEVLPPAPSVSAGPDKVACSEQPVQLEASASAFEYLWSPSVGISDKNILNPTANPAVSTEYTLTVWNAYGCSASDTVAVGVGQSPIPATIGVSPSTTVCEGTIISVGVSYSPDELVHFSKPSMSVIGGGGGQGGFSFGAYAHGSGDFVVIKRNAAGCRTTTTLSLTVNPLPASRILETTLNLCHNGYDAIAYYPTPGSVAFMYPPQIEKAYSTGVPSVAYEIIRPTASAVIGETYTIKGYTVLQGCTTTVNIPTTIVEGVDTPVITATNTVICQGGNALLTTQNISGTTYEWRKNGLLVQAGPSASYLATTPGRYGLRVTNSNGCMALASDLTLTSSSTPAPRVTTHPDQTICEGGSTQLVVGRVLDFNGIDQYAIVEDFKWPINGTGPIGGPITVEFWIKSEALGYRSAFSMGAFDNPNRIQAHIPWNNEVMYWDYGNTLGQGRVTAPFTGYMNKWVHVALVSMGNNGSYKAIYINGELKGEDTGPSDGPDLILTRLWFGRFQPVVGLHDGMIDEFRVWNRVLSPIEIQACMKTIVPASSPDLVGCYRFDELSGNDFYDATMNQKHGYLQNNSSVYPMRKLPESDLIYNWYPASGLNAATGTEVLASPQASTVYRVTGTSPNGCATTAEVNVTINTACREVFITEQEDEDWSVALSPNPAWNDVTVKFIHPTSDLASVSLLDINGKIVYSNKVITSEDHIARLDKIPSGVYTVMIATETDQKILRLVITH